MIKTVTRKKGDTMTVKELLSRADVTTQTHLAAAVLEEEYGDKPKRMDLLQELYENFLQKMRQIQPAPSGDVVLFSVEWEYTSPDNRDKDNALSLRIVPTHYLKQGLLDYLPSVQPIKTYSLNTLEKMPVHDIDKASLKFKFPESYAIEWETWHTILGWNVLPENLEIADIDEEYCVAALLDEMTFNGFTEEDQEKRRIDLEKAVEEAKIIAKLPAEEQMKHLHTQEEVEKSLYDDFGWKRPVKTEAEEEFDSRWFSVADYLSKAERYNLFCDIKDPLFKLLNTKQ